MLPTNTNDAPRNSCRPPAPTPGEPASSPTPKNPTIKPIVVLLEGRFPEPNRVSSNTIHMGTVATIRATRPLGTHCSATTTAPLPPTSKSVPEIAPLLHWTKVGAESPRVLNQVYISAPATRKRTAAIPKGGIVSIANRIARYVEPQMT